MKSYWQNLNEREKGILVAGVLSAFFFIYYSFLYDPLTTELEKNKTLLLEKKETLAWMKKIDPKNLPSSQLKTLNNSQLLTLIAKQLKETPRMEFPYQLQQTGSGDVQLSFDKVPFENLIAWLAKLADSYLVLVKQFTVDKTDTKGMTKVMIIMSTNTSGK